MTQMLHPQWLWLLLIYLPLIAWYVYNHRNAHPTMRMSTTQAFDGVPASWRTWLTHLPFALRLAALGCLIVILCRPQTHDSWSTSDVEGTDIIVAMDVSTSMLAKDFKPNRMESAKKVATQFVAGREHDNIGLVLFAGESFTQVPMTMDNATLVNAIGQIKMGCLRMVLPSAMALPPASIASRMAKPRARASSCSLTDRTTPEWLHRSPLLRLPINMASKSTPSVSEATEQLPILWLSTLQETFNIKPCQW